MTDFRTFQNLATKARNEAAQVIDGAIRAGLLKVADQYDAMAKYEARRRFGMSPQEAIDARLKSD
jgi:hypothetical protein